MYITIPRKGELVPYCDGESGRPPLYHLSIAVVRHRCWIPKAVAEGTRNDRILTVDQREDTEISGPIDSVAFAALSTSLSSSCRGHHRHYVPAYYQR